MRMGERSKEPIEVIPTGSIQGTPLDAGAGAVSAVGAFRASHRLPAEVRDAGVADRLRRVAVPACPDAA
ncbi:hypothetical protein AB0907_39125, partial [Streptomyces sp. NPDC006975]|uniref:hypothetical protein n=1 Tax=Streptomyces sp. NPDC006975 TaxID=3154310 RepID=UPI003454AEDA